MDKIKVQTHRQQELVQENIQNSNFHQFKQWNPIDLRATGETRENLVNAATLTCSGNVRLCYLETDRTTQRRSRF